MPNPPFGPGFVRSIPVMIVLGALGCSSTPTGPTAPAAGTATLPPLADSRDVGTPVNLAQCLGGSGSASCFSSARVRAASESSAPLTSAPILNNNQPLLTSPATVTLVVDGARGWRCRKLCH